MKGTLRQTTLLDFFKPKAAATGCSTPQQQSMATATATAKRLRDPLEESLIDTQPKTVVKLELSGACASTAGGRKVQTTLDFGQRDDAVATCPNCGMVFSTTTSDRATHQRFCKKAAAQRTSRRVEFQLPSDVAARHFKAGRLADVTMLLVPDLSALAAAAPAAPLVQAILSHDRRHERRLAASVSSRSCLVAALHLRAAGRVTNLGEELLGFVIGAHNQRLFVASGTTAPPVTLCDVHVLSLQRRALRAREVAANAGGVTGMNDADKDLFGSLLAPTTTDFFVCKRTVVDDSVLHVAGARVAEALLETLSLHVVYGVRVDLQRQTSIPSWLAPRPSVTAAPCDAGSDEGDGGHVSSDGASQQLSSDDDDEVGDDDMRRARAKASNDPALFSFEHECLRCMATVDLKKVHVHDETASNAQQ